MNEITNTRRSDELRATASNLLRIAAELEHSHVPQAAPKPARQPLNVWGDLDDSYLLEKTNEIYKSRRRRNRVLPQHLFGEPAWDILLDLFVAHLQARLVPTTSACIAADVPMTTALRWIAVLENEQLVRRSKHKSDSRVMNLQITEDGYAKMRSIISNNFRPINPISSNENYVFQLK